MCYGVVSLLLVLGMVYFGAFHFYHLDYDEVESRDLSFRLIGFISNCSHPHCTYYVLLIRSDQFVLYATFFSQALFPLITLMFTGVRTSM